MNDFEVVEILEQMAHLTGNEGDVEHWQALVKQDPEHIRRCLTKDGRQMGMIIFSWDPRTGNYIPTHLGNVLVTSLENVEQMIHSWALNQTVVYGRIFPLAMAKKSMKIYLFG